MSSSQVDQLLLPSQPLTWGCETGQLTLEVHGLGQTSLRALWGCNTGPKTVPPMDLGQIYFLRCFYVII